MPTTINGVGTHYYGKRNPTTHFGFCNQCKRELLLTDYETTLWFVVIYIPLIPLGKKQIVNQCPGCTYHYAVPLKTWQKQGDDAVAQVSESLAQNTSDPAKAIEMHATLSGFHRHEESGELAKVLLSKFGENSEVLFYLGSWHEHFTRFKEADELFVKASDREPADMDKQAAAVFALARQKEVDAALKRMETLTPPAIPERVDLVRHVARQFAAVGRAEDAYRLLTRLVQANPALSNRPDIQKEIRPLEKQLGIKQSLVTAESFWSKPIAKWLALAAVIVVILLGVEGWNLYIQQNAPLHAVNGIGAPVQFSIDGGAPQTIPPKGRIKVTLPEGRHRVTLLSPPLPGADPYDIEVTQPWHRRFFSKPAFIIDPSRTAVVLHEVVPYAEMPQAGIAPQDKFHIGAPYTAYDQVDHRFEDFPQQVDLGSNHVVYRSGTMLVDVDPVYLLGRGATPREITDAAKRRIAADPKDASALEQLAGIMLTSGQEKELEEFVKLHLTDDPPLLTWHRIYQNIASNRPAMLAEYDRLLAAHPQSAAFIYLRGRICEDLDKSIGYFDRAVAADPNFMHAYLAKAHSLSSRAEYTQAAELLHQAWDRLVPSAPAEMSPADIAYFTNKVGEDRLEALISSGAYAEFDSVELATRAQLRQGGPGSYVYLSMLRQGKTEAIQQHRNELQTRVAQLGAQGGLIRGSLLLSDAIYDNDLSTMRNAASQMPEPPRKQLLDAISFDDQSSPTCNSVLGVSAEVAPVLQKMLTSLRCRELGQPYEPARQEALELLKSGLTASPGLLALFEKSPHATIEEMNKISLQDRERGIFLIALAYENPDQKKAMLRYARRLLTIPRLPQKCLDDWIKKGLGE